MSKPLSQLPAPRRRFPLEKGLYEVAPGLRSFQPPAIDLDQEFEKYRVNKFECRKEKLAKYYQTASLDPKTEAAACMALIEKLTTEHPLFFERIGNHLYCRLTEDVLGFDSAGSLTDFQSPEPVLKIYPPVSLMDAIALQIQEDIAIHARNPEGRNWLASLHLSSASHWSPHDKIGKDFRAIHAPIPGVEKMNRAAESLVDASIRKGPYERYVWGFATDKKLNHHPNPPPGADPEEWKGRTFDLTAPTPFNLRVERQVILGLSPVDAHLFLIRVSFVDGHTIRKSRTESQMLIQALRSMTPESRAYKGVDGYMDELTTWLDPA
jgi:hypothetical protein